MPEISRRAFLATLAAATAGALVLDPERLLWVPGEKTIFLPPEKRMVLAEATDIEALIASIGGPLVVGAPYRAGLTSVYMTPDPQAAVRMLTDQEYRLLIDRGRKMLAAKRQIVAPARGWR